MIAAFAAGLSLAIAAAPGCAFGPKVLERTHGRYNEAIRRVDEEQLLRNLVRVRYNDTPFELNVSSIAAQYELSGGAEARPFFEAPNPASTGIFRTFTRVLPDATIGGANRPTITFLPANNGEALQRFLTPITPETLVFLGQTSWPVSTVLRLWVERLNGVPNAPSASGPQRPQVPDFERFLRVADLIQAAQDHGLGSVHAEERFTPIGAPLPVDAVDAAAAIEAVKNGLEYRKSDDGSSWTLGRNARRLVFEANPVYVGHPELLEIEGLLNLQPGRQRYEIMVAPGVVLDPLRAPSEPSTKIEVSPRSTAQVYFFLANGIDVPTEHIEAGLVHPAVYPDGRAFDGRAVTAGLFRVHTCQGHKPPETAYVAVKHRGYWYYIDDRDAQSKVTFALVLQLSRLNFVRQLQSGGPFLTLPIGR